MIRTIIVDDELHAREELAAMLAQTRAFEIVGKCAHAVEALQAIKRDLPDVMFLDIRMPGLSGFEMLSMIDEEIMPVVVFVTAYDEYALKAFDENAVDYLLKPVEPERLRKTVHKLRKMVREPARTPFSDVPITRIPCMLSQRIKLIGLHDVECIRSDIAGVYVITGAGEFFTELTLKVLEERTGMVRCHKQFLVNIDRADEILLHDNQSAHIRMQSGKTVPVSRRFFKKLKEKFGF
jgi:two-component system, LytTR family, response regulator